MRASVFVLSIGLAVLPMGAPNSSRSIQVPLCECKLDDSGVITAANVQCGDPAHPCMQFTIIDFASALNGRCKLGDSPPCTEAVGCRPSRVTLEWTFVDCEPPNRCCPMDAASVAIRFNGQEFVIGRGESQQVVEGDFELACGSLWWDETIIECLSPLPPRTVLVDRSRIWSCLHCPARD